MENKVSDLHCRDASAAMPLTSLAALAQTTEHCLGELAALLSEVESSGLSDSDTAALIDAARRLAQLQGALELIDQPGSQADSFCSGFKFSSERHCARCCVVKR
ncbi:MAG: hypothetical protein EBW14_01145 [Oxalobacteraceae bacterium]|nr:hypothetical protein [Oxalobacteraceae bacterium]